MFSYSLKLLWRSKNEICVLGPGSNRKKAGSGSKNTGGSGFIIVFKFLATETVPKLEVQRSSDGCALAL